MKKCIDISKIVRAMETLDRVRKYIDPRAFIAGGFATECFMGEDWGSDIDIFFSSPNFEYTGLDTTSFNQLELVFGDILKGVNHDTYWYNKRFTRVARMNDIDFIQIKEAPSTKIHEYVFDKFDINLCKAIVTPCWKNKINIITSEAFDEGLKKKTLIYELNLADHSYENNIQNTITENRLDKYKKRFKQFKVKEVK